MYAVPSSCASAPRNTREAGISRYLIRASKLKNDRGYMALIGTPEYLLASALCIYQISFDILVFLAFNGCKGKVLEEKYTYKIVKIIKKALKFQFFIS